MTTTRKILYRNEGKLAPSNISVICNKLVLLQYVQLHTVQALPVESPIEEKRMS